MLAPRHKKSASGRKDFRTDLPVRGRKGIYSGSWDEAKQVAQEGGGGEDIHRRYRKRGTVSQVAFLGEQSQFAERGIWDSGNAFVRTTEEKSKSCSKAWAGLHRKFRS